MIPSWFVPTITTGRHAQEARADDDFVYEIACAQLCGLGHYSMRGYVTIDTPEASRPGSTREGKKLNSEDAAWN